MTTAKKPEFSAAERELKRRGRRRLIGAATLGLLAIVILPMVFDSAPKSDPLHKKPVKQEIAIQIPPKEGLPPVTAPAMPPSVPGIVATDLPSAPATSLTGKPGAAVEAGAKPAAADTKRLPQESKPEVVVAPAEAAVATMAAKTVAAEANVAPKTTTKPEPVKAGFVVQVGAFKDADNAKSILAQMKDAKLPVFTDTIAVKSGNVTRVRVGPFATKSKAESALAQVKLAGADGKVVPVP